MKSAFSKSTFNIARQRHGVAMILAIIVLIFSAAISLSMVRTTTLRQKRFENRIWKTQANLIADSAIDRAYQQLAKDNQYSGEVWKVVTHDEQGTATISVAAKSPQKYAVSIIAIYPVSSPIRTQTTIDVIINMNRDES